MVNTKQSNRQRVGSWIVLGILVVLVLFSNRLYAQADDAASQQPPSADTASPDAGLEQQQPTLGSQPPTETQQPTEPPQGTNSSPDNGASQQPAVRSIETGLPLHSVVSPLRWGHLSLLSFTALRAYDTNYQPQGAQQPQVGSALTALQALLIYSIQRSRWSLDLQYRPYAWFSGHTSHTNFTAHAVDFHTGHNFGREWRLNVTDSYAYSPAPVNLLGSPFSADFFNNTTSSTSFLSTGRKSLINSADLAMERVLNERSKLSFSFTDIFIDLSENSTNPAGPTASPTPTMRHTYGPGATWSRQWSRRNTISLTYSYRHQTYPGSIGSTDFQHVGVGYTRILRPSLTATLEIGPGWSSASTGRTSNPYRRTTLQGSAELFKQFKKGGVALSFYRNSDFSGVISNSYSNRYNLAITRHFYTRWDAELSGSYVQQEFVGRHTITGEMGFAQLAYLLSRNWSLFTSYRYFSTSRSSVNDTLLGPQQIVSVGIRWAWKPETTTGN